MRISSQGYFQSTQRQMIATQSRLFGIQHQIGSGKKLNHLQEDPISYSKVQAENQKMHLIEQFGVNIQRLDQKLMSMDAIFSDFSSQLQQMRETIIYVNNGADSDTDRNILIAELEAGLAHLINLANSKDEHGNYLFAGIAQNSQPVVVDSMSGDYIYQGSSIVTEVPIGVGKTMKTSFDGQSLFFQSNAFNVLQDAIDGLNTASSNAEVSTASDNFLASLSGFENEILTSRAELGLRLNRLDAERSLQEEDVYFAKALISRLEDLDYAEAITQLEQERLALQALQGTLSRILDLNLFQWLR